jgi:glutamate-1-semialdehyde aminotransferase
VIEELGLNAVCVGYGSAWGVWFDKTPPQSHEDVARYNASGGREKSAAYTRHMLNHGVFVQPVRPSKGYLYAAHTEDDVQHTIDATASFLKEHQGALR